MKPFFAGAYQHPSLSSRHFCIVGTTGSGKTVTLQLLMQSVIPALATSPDSRALVYDAKGDAWPLVATIAPAMQVKNLNPFDRRGFAWDMCKDITTPATALQIASILVPEEREGNNRFFTDSARHLLAGVFLGLIFLTQERKVSWTLRDVILIARNRKLLETLCSKCPYTQDLRVYFDSDSRETQSILSTIASRLSVFEPIAALWEHARGRISLDDWVKERSILVLGNNETSRLALDAINRAIFQRLTEIVLAQSEDTERRTWFFLDEVREAGKLEGLSRLLTKGRSKGACVVLGFQEFDGMKEVYGEHVANEIVGQCGSKAILRVASPVSAQWASDLSGSYLREEVTDNSGTSQARAEATHSRGESTSIQERKSFYTSEFLNVPYPDPQVGLTAFYALPQGFRRLTFNPFPYLLKPDPLVPHYLPQADKHQFLERWSDADAHRLALVETPPAAAGIRLPSRKEWERGTNA